MGKRGVAASAERKGLRLENDAFSGGAPVCPICGDPTNRWLQAEIAAFVRERCGLTGDVQGQSYFCAECEHVFIAPLLTAEQISRLYKDYRGNLYNEQRIRLEPDYAAIALEFADEGSAYFDARRAFYDDFNDERFRQEGLVVDLSDGGGYFARYAYPRADVVVLPRVGLPPGVRLKQLLASADVLMSTHALQTEPRPREMLSGLVNGLRPGATAWIEVPTQYRGGLRANFEVQEARFANGFRQFGPLQTLHENLAHFSLRSLSRLLAAAGLIPTQFVRASIGVLGVFAYKGQAESQRAADGETHVERLGTP